MPQYAVPMYRGADWPGCHGVGDIRRAQPEPFYAVKNAPPLHVYPPGATRPGLLPQPQISASP